MNKAIRFKDLKINEFFRNLGGSMVVAHLPPLRRFLDAAAGEGLVLDGIDAADLYVSLFGNLPPGVVVKGADHG